MKPTARVTQVVRLWPVVVPPAAVVVLVASWSAEPGIAATLAVTALLIAAVVSAVIHAEVVAHRVGEPFGSLLLAVAVTIIEVGLIVMLMLSSPASTTSLARDTVFAAVMITMNGILGVSILVGSLRHRITVFNAQGSGAALATVATIATLCLVLPTFTSSAAGPQFSGPQLAFAAVTSLVLYLVFVLTQTVQHRDFFLPVELPDHSASSFEAGASHALPPSTRTAVLSFGMLLLALVAVVGLAKVQSPAIESSVTSAGLPQATVGIVIALVILLPESLAAFRAARRNRLQTSINLSFGSAMASIGLTIPAIAVASLWLEGPLELGLGATQIVLLALTLFLCALTVVPGQATRLQGAMHMAILAAFVFLAINP